MFGWLMIICSIAIMYKAAEIENRNGLLWGVYTFGCCIGMVYLLPSWVFINIFIGLAVSFSTMFTLNIVKG